MKGYQGMFLRDAPGFAFYFCSYEFIKRQLGVTDSEGKLIITDANKSASLFLSGGIAGVSTWILCYPADFLKTRL